MIVPSYEQMKINLQTSGLRHVDTAHIQIFMDYAKLIPGAEINVDACMHWGLAHNDLGYGVYNIQGHNIHTHRLVYMAVFGTPADPLPRTDPCKCGSGKQYGSCCRAVVRHICQDVCPDCDVSQISKCLNPMHMQLGTQTDNQRDIARHGTGRGKVMPGETHPQAKMSNEKAMEVWQDIKAGKEGYGRVKLKEIAEKHSVSYDTVKDMSSGKTWNCVTGLPISSHKFAVRRDNYESKHMAAALSQKRKAEEAGLPADHIGNGYISKKVKIDKDDADDTTKQIVQAPTEAAAGHTEIKRCSRCKEVYPITFYSWYISGEVLRSSCKNCDKAENAKRKPKTVRQERFADERVLRDGEKYAHCMRCNEEVPEHGMSNPSWCKRCRREWERDNKAKKAMGATEGAVDTTATPHT